MNYETFFDMVHFEVKDEYYHVECEKIEKFCKENNVHCECFYTINDRKLAKMMVILLEDKFWVAYATIGEGKEYWLYYDEFVEVTKEVINRELEDLEEFRNKLKEIEKFVDEGYKKKIMLQNVFNSKSKK